MREEKGGREEERERGGLGERRKGGNVKTTFFYFEKRSSCKILLRTNDSFLLLNFFKNLHLYSCSETYAFKFCIVKIETGDR